MRVSHSSHFSRNFTFSFSFTGLGVSELRAHAQEVRDALAEAATPDNCVLLKLVE